MWVMSLLEHGRTADEIPAGGVGQGGRIETLPVDVYFESLPSNSSTEVNVNYMPLFP
jgi:hypothetical protein